MADHNLTPGRHVGEPAAPQDGDATMDAYWDLGETLAWIVYRSKRAVLRERAHQRAVTAHPHPGETAKSRHRRTRAQNHPPIIFRREGREAFPRLRPHLEKSTIRADGRRELFGRRQPIPRREWADLSCSVMTANPPTDALVVTFTDVDMRYGVAAPRPGWRDVRFRVADIIKMFPPKAVPVSAPTPPPVEPEPEPPEPAPRSKPEFPNNLDGRIAGELWEGYPEGRRTKVKVMKGEFAGKCSPRTFDKALALLAKRDPKTWPQQRRRPRRPKPT